MPYLTQPKLRIPAIALLALGLASVLAPMGVRAVPALPLAGAPMVSRLWALPQAVLRTPLALRPSARGGNGALPHVIGHHFETMTAPEASGWLLVGSGVGLSGLGFAYLHAGNNDLRTAPGKVGIAMIGLGGLSLGGAGAFLGAMRARHGGGAKVMPQAPEPVLPACDSAVSTIEKDKKSSMAFHVPLLFGGF